MVKGLSIKIWTLHTLSGHHLGCVVEGEKKEWPRVGGSWNHKLYLYVYGYVYCVNLVVCYELEGITTIMVKRCDCNFK